MCVCVTYTRNKVCTHTNTMEMLPYPRQRDQLLHHWLHEEEMKLRQFAEARASSAVGHGYGWAMELINLVYLVNQATSQSQKLLIGSQLKLT